MSAEVDVDIKMRTKKRRKVVKRNGRMVWFAIVPIVILVIVLAVCYIYVARSYRTRFLPNSKINGIECSGMNAAEISALLTPSTENYALEVTGRNYVTGEPGAVLGRITASDVGMRFEGIQASVEKILLQQKRYQWIAVYFSDKSANYSVDIKMIYDKDKVKNALQSWDALQEKNMRVPQNAYISAYSEKSNSYEVIPETISTKVDTALVSDYIIEALNSGKTALDLDAMGCYTDAAVKGDDAQLNNTVNTVNRWLSASITYDWNGTAVVLDKETLRNWISIVGDEPVLDTEKVGSFVKKQAAQYDTYGKDRRFVTALGVELVLPSGYYGWQTDVAGETEALLQLIEQGGSTKREPIYSSKARKKGASDIGNSYVEADMTHQHMYLYSNGKLVLETDFVSGDMATGCDTPEGVFGISYKTTNKILRGRDYADFVYYWMPYYGNYGMHDATWRDEFGGDIYLTNGSHGCLNLPLEKAGQIYQYMSAGFPVICYFYDVDPLAGREEPPIENEDEDEDEDEEE